MRFAHPVPGRRLPQTLDRMGLPSWHDLSRAFDDAGDTARAVHVLESAVSEGHMGALVVLARLKWKHGAFNDAVKFMKQAERKVEADDWETHFDMHIAYSIGIGSDDGSATKRLAFQHLLTAADASGDSRMKLSVGLHYWHGLNEVEPNLDLADRWLSEAAASGIPDIVKDYERFLKAKHKPRKRAT